MDIGSILSTALKPLWAKVLAALIPLAIIMAGAWVAIEKHKQNKLVETSKEAGAASAVNQGHETTFGQLGDANEAENNLGAGSERNAERYSQCLQDSRRASACERFRPLDD